MSDYNYDYHDLAENADFLEEDDSFFGNEEDNFPTEDENQEYKHYYHSMLDELDD